MEQSNKPRRVGTVLASLACSGLIPFVAIYVGSKVTPGPNEIWGSLIPVAVYGAIGTAAAVMSFPAALWVFRATRLGALRLTVAMIICGFACAGAVYVGLKVMLQYRGTTY